ncbi:MAG: cohesin domain-containing protein, partial [Methanosarcinales archaeon]
VNVTNASRVCSVDFNLTYNPTVLNATNITEGSLLPSGSSFEYTINNSIGKIVVGIVKAAPGISGSGTIANITFEVIGSADSTSSLNFSGVIFGNDSLTNPGPIPPENYTISNSTFTVLSPPYVPPVPVPALSSIGQVVLAILLLLILMRVGIKYKR